MFKTATFFLLHCDEWDHVVSLPRHKFVTGATLLQLGQDYAGDTEQKIQGGDTEQKISSEV